MKCKECKGGGVHYYDDPDWDGAVPCINCGGTGRHSIFWPAYLRVCCWIDMQKENMRFTRLGTKYWRIYGRFRRAKKLMAGRTAFELAALHGQSLNRLRVFATALENGTNIDRAYRIETRLAEERRLACKWKQEEESQP